MIKYSFIVPIYNVEKYLNRCIDSILSQDYKNFELILIDDGSPDGCSQICDSYAKKDNRIRVIHKVNGGLVSARNKGIEEAKGDFICYVDGDDWIKSNLISSVNKIINRYNDVDMVVYSGRRIFEDHMEDLPFDIEEGLYDKKRLNVEIYPYMMYDRRKPFCNGLVFPVAWNKIYKRELLKKHYCTNEKIKMGEDNAFVFECLLHADKVFFLDEKLYEYNQLNTVSFTNSYDKDRFYNNRLLTEYISSRISGINEMIDYQINAFNAYWLIMAVFHEVKNNNSIINSKRHIAEQIKENESLSNIKLKGLPLTAKFYITMLRLHLYYTTLICSNIVNKIRS